MKALIVAGGKGTRLWSLNNDQIPKPMTVLCGKPILQWAIECLKQNGITEIYISIQHLGQKIVDYFKDGKDFGVNVHYLWETTPLGSGGALFYLKNIVDDDFIVCSGDTLFDINIQKMVDFHKSKNAIITLLTHPNSHPFDSDLVKTDANDRVVGFDSKNNVRNYYYKNNVNAGFFVINPIALYFFSEEKAISMEHDFINYFVQRGESVFAYKSFEYIKDVGTEKRFLAAQTDIKTGLVAKRNSKNKQKAIFLDRDGTVNQYKGFLSDITQLELCEGAAQALKTINESEYLAILISNQPIVARGECSFAQLNAIFDKLETLLGKQGAYLDGCYFCPHHPHKGYEGEVADLKIDCTCRKPKIGMLLQAVKEFNLDLSQCIFVGDTSIDILTGKNAGIPQILVPSPATETNCISPTYVAKDLPDAINFVFNKLNKTN